MTEIKQRRLARRRTVRQTATDCTLECHVSGQTVKPVHFATAVQRIIRRFCRYFPPTQDGSSDCSRTVIRDSRIQRTYYRVRIKSFPDYKKTTVRGIQTFFFQNVTYEDFLQHIGTDQHVWGTARWFTRTALKGLTHSINSLITHTGPVTSVKVTNTASLNKLWIPLFDAFNIWRRSSVLISEFLLHWDRRFCFVIPQNTLGFLLHWRHFVTSSLCNCNITILSFLVINVCNQGKADPSRHEV